MFKKKTREYKIILKLKYFSFFELYYLKELVYKEEKLLTFTLNN
jgi:hypothetical protein